MVILAINEIINDEINSVPLFPTFTFYPFPQSASCVALLFLRVGNIRSKKQIKRKIYFIFFLQISLIPVLLFSPKKCTNVSHPTCTA